MTTTTTIPAGHVSVQKGYTAPCGRQYHPTTDFDLLGWMSDGTDGKFNADKALAAVDWGLHSPANCGEGITQATLWEALERIKPFEPMALTLRARVEFTREFEAKLIADRVESVRRPSWV